jgi:hypothetical protein
MRAALYFDITMMLLSLYMAVLLRGETDAMRPILLACAVSGALVLAFQAYVRMLAAEFPLPSTPFNWTQSLLLPAAIVALVYLHIVGKSAILFFAIPIQGAACGVALMRSLRMETPAQAANTASNVARPADAPLPAKPAEAQRVRTVEMPAPAITHPPIAAALPIAGPAAECPAAGKAAAQAPAAGVTAVLEHPAPAIVPAPIPQPAPAIDENKWCNDWTKLFPHGKFTISYRCPQRYAKLVYECLIDRVAHTVAYITMEDFNRNLIARGIPAGVAEFICASIREDDETYLRPDQP